MPKGYPKNNKKNSHQWTKEEIKKIIKMWDESSMEEILNQTGLTRGQIGSIRNEIKKAGYVLTNKKTTGYRQLLVGEVLRELKLIK